MTIKSVLMAGTIALAFLLPLGLAYAEPEAEEGFAKCGTPELLRMLSTGRAKPALRPERHVSAVSGEGHFRVHYDTLGYHAPDMTDTNGDGVPDYVQAALDYLEHALDHEVNTLGYIEPLSDNGAGGGDELDVYIREYGGGGYGITEPWEIVDGKASSFITIDNNYIESQYASHGLEGLKVSTAHELFHAIQFAYVTDFSLSWWMEQSAVWMEEQVWNDVNDYLAYLRFFFYDTAKNKTPLTTSYGNFMYGATLWPMYLSKRFGVETIRLTWEHLAAADNPSILTFDEVLPDGVARAYNEFGVWNYFTDGRANTVDFHTESNRFGYMTPIDWKSNFSPDSQSYASNIFTNRYIEIRFVGGHGEHDALALDIAPDDGATFTSSLVWYQDPHDYRIVDIEDGAEYYPMMRGWDKAVLVVSCTNSSGSDHGFTYNAELLTGVTAEQDAPVAFDPGAPYPNPFNPSTSIPITLERPGHVTVRVFNANGQEIAVLADEEFSAGETLLVWKPERDMAAGVYFISVDAPDGSVVKKAAFVK